MTAYPIQVAVRSASNGAAVHMVTLPYCDCADFTNRKGKVIEIPGGFAVTLCKHLIEALERVGGWHRPAETGEVIPRLDPAEALALLTGPRVRMRQGEARAVLSALTMRRTETSDFNGTAVKGFVTYDPLKSRFEVTILP